VISIEATARHSSSCPSTIVSPAPEPAHRARLEERYDRRIDASVAEFPHRESSLSPMSALGNEATLGDVSSLGDQTAIGSAR
jgi:hypothetical protein